MAEPVEDNPSKQAPSAILQEPTDLDSHYTLITLLMAQAGRFSEYKPCKLKHNTDSRNVLGVRVGGL
ncbi:hypothetical protein AG1IA_05482 [Rhizoctonia solani AG-1 IA]|uniref:Uncharacterized protein n=1 Tax=Thanatephorus cucumeris (strain AG1-IA) TaxID=983506 RepID=L8WVV0_THACA|nr:hypothetical protein AG1IA_05482 [Rhizoctonia solani AG-1 IA]